MSNISYEKKRELCIGIIGCIQDWCEAHDIETSPADDAALAQMIFDKIKTDLKDNI